MKRNLQHRHSLPSNLVRFNVHFELRHVSRLVPLARQLAARKGRDVRPGEALSLALTAALALSDEALLASAPSDIHAPYWSLVGRTDMHGGDVLLPKPLEDSARSASR
jgi:hypothetical protein